MTTRIIGKTVSLAALLGCMLAQPWPAAAGPGMLQGPGIQPGGFGGTGNMLPALLRSVNLTDEQRTEVRSIVDRRRPRLMKLFAKVNAAQRDMADRILGAEAVTDESLDALVARLEHARSDLMREGVQIVLDARELLTEDQLTELVETRERYRDLQSEMRRLLRPDDSAATD